MGSQSLSHQHSLSPYMCRVALIQPFTRLEPCGVTRSVCLLYNASLYDNYRALVLPDLKRPDDKSNKP